MTTKSHISPAEAEIRPGTRPGFVEIYFAARPDTAELSALKASRFRYAPRPTPRWYGLAASVPASYAPAVAALRTLQEVR